MLLVLASSAFAQGMNADVAIEAPCEDLYVSATLPETASEGFPLDGQPAVLFGGGCGWSTWTFTLEQEGEVLHSEEHLMEVPQALRIAHALQLEPFTTYQLRAASDDGWNEETLIEFTTGEDFVVGTLAPSTGGAQAGVSGNTGSWGVWGSVEVRPAEDPDGLSILHLLSADGDVLTSAFAFEETTLNRPWTWQDSIPDEVCFRVTQEDGSGVRQEADSVCVTPTVERSREGGRVRGCSATGTGGGLLVGLFGLLALRRRETA